MKPDFRASAAYKPARPNCIFLLGGFADLVEQRRGRHFSGGAGQELKRMCEEAGFDFFDSHNEVVFSVPKMTRHSPSHYWTDWPKNPMPRLSDTLDHLAFLRQRIVDTKPRVIVTMGDIALHALTGKTSAFTWRGSCLEVTVGGHKCKLIPTFDPHQILRVWDWRHIMVQDLVRAERESHSETYKIPDYNFLVAPSFSEAYEWQADLLARLDAGPVQIAHDLETINRYIACSGLAISVTEAMCLPFMTRETETPETPHNYWSLRDEAKLLEQHIKILRHPNARIIGQNYLYDCQHTAHWWGIVPRVDQDTMLSWHTLFPANKKSLDYIASMLCEYYVYWKDELKDYNKYPEDELQFWTYNCKDVSYTWEIASKLPELLELGEQTEQAQFQHDMFWPALKAMIRGVRIDKKRRAALQLQLMELSAKIESELLAMTGDYHPPGSKAKTRWYNSPKQAQSYFYDYLGLKKKFDKKTGKPTTNDDALTALAQEQPVIKPIVDRIQALRSVNIFRKNFVEAPLGDDGRIRCSYNIAGTETFRFSSSKDAFGRGANLQTIPSGNED